ncbi:hypothetical protein E1263_12925 [Kribbella antibiotica]|uniref:Uncharacterized protein n=1 Tax=Kribbella antibiotica TaxID=190195 RepID=A0A4R4ZN14_9ACTN|nr:hypothetical protein [Kribbella antibiotica]TDD59995.1 hypothetical protein E1263_12925 [Kribbella antibiotica]
MSTADRLLVPVGPDSAPWRTISPHRTVLVIVHTVTAWNRFADILPVFDSDRRVQLVFTFPDASAVSAGIEEHLVAQGTRVIPWERALAADFDLALSAHHSGDLHKVRAPLAVLSHGMGYTKYSHRDTGTPGHRDTYGLSARWLLRGGELTPASIILTHHEQLDRLAAVSAEALSSAFVGGDPCFDRLMVSAHRREHYRRALGVHDDRTIVAVTSTWGSRSLFGTNPDLIATLAAELELDSYVVAVILHPNTWYAHSPAQIRLWLGDCLRSGVRLIPPAEGWQQTILAADITIGDNGSVSGYSAAAGRPTLLATFPVADVVPTSAIDALGQSSARLNLHAAFEPQIIAAGPPDPRIRALTTSVPSEASARHRAEFYRLMHLPEPQSPAILPQYDADQLRPMTQPVSSWWASTSKDADGNYTVRRWPASVVGRPDYSPEDMPRHLVASADEPRRDLFANAAICVVNGPAATPSTVFRERPACSMVAVRTGPATCSLVHRTGWTADLAVFSATNHPVDPAIPTSVIHDQLAAQRTPPETFEILLGSTQITAALSQVSSKAE